MLLADTLKMANFITLTYRQPFTWGELDCNTFVARAIDAIRGTDRADREIVGQYNDQKSAIRFYKNYTSAEQYIQDMGWKQIDHCDLAELDILLCDQAVYKAAHIVFAGKIWSCHKEHGIVAVEGLENMTSPYTQWRRT